MSVQSSNRQESNFFAAVRITSISACEVGVLELLSQVVSYRNNLVIAID